MQQADEVYKERVLPGLASCIPILLIYPSIYLVFLPIDTVFGNLLGILATLVGISAIVANSTVLKIDSTSFSAGRAHLGFSEIERIEVIQGESAFAERTSKLDARAYVAIKSSVPKYLKVFLKSTSEDPTPYWLLSTRRPEALKLLLDSKISG